MDDVVKLKARARRLELLSCFLLVGCGAMTLSASQSEPPRRSAPNATRWSNRRVECAAIGA